MCSNSMAIAHVIFEVTQTKIKGGCQSGRKVVPHDSKSDLPLGGVQCVCEAGDFRHARMPAE